MGLYWGYIRCVGLNRRFIAKLGLHGGEYSGLMEKNRETTMMGLGLSMGSCVVLLGFLIDSLQRKRKTKNYIGTLQRREEMWSPRMGARFRAEHHGVPALEV